MLHLLCWITKWKDICIQNWETFMRCYVQMLTDSGLLEAVYNRIDQITSWLLYQVYTFSVLGAFKKAELGVTKRSDGASPEAGKIKKDGTPKPTQAVPTAGTTKATRPATVKVAETKRSTTAAPIVTTKKPKQTCFNKNCAHQCRETGLGPMCSCRRGYSLASDGTSCQGSYSYKLQNILFLENK